MGSGPPAASAATASMTTVLLGPVTIAAKATRAHGDLENPLALGKVVLMVDR